MICVGVDVLLVLMSTSVGDRVVGAGRCAHAPCPRGATVAQANGEARCGIGW
jgi:hypothetical protein